MYNKFMEKQSDAFLKVCAERIQKGEAKYGPVRADDRNRCQEAIEEIQDCFNYVVPIMLAKHPKIKETAEWEWAVTCIYRTYKALVELKPIEDEMESKLKEVSCE